MSTPPQWQSTQLRIPADAVAAFGACLIAGFLRYDLSFPPRPFFRTLLVYAGYGAVAVVANALWGLYRGRWKLASFEEMGRLALSNATATCVFLVADLAIFSLKSFVPLGAVLIAGSFSFIAQGGVRYAWRAREEWRERQAAAGNRATIVAGAGQAGEQIVRAMLAHPENGRRPVAFLDDDPIKKNLALCGIRVMGRLDDIRKVVAVTEAKELLIAMPTAEPALIRELGEESERLGLAVTVLPSALELLRRGRGVDVTDIRRVSIVDLLGREPVDRQLADAATYVLGKRVLVTGAGGSIGTELCRQLQSLNPRQIVLFDHDETNLHALQLELRGSALLDVPELVVGDVRDAARLDSVFADRRPDVVFHVAAHKHLPLLEMHPCEAVKTNVGGTINVARAAGRSGCSHFVNVSTDKAAEPTSVLGATKRVSELVCQHLELEFPGTLFTTVRFGNVLGSRGGIVSVFEQQIANGGPLTVTHPEATRYFMTVAEAAQLVIRAGAASKGGDTFVLDMGEPVRILDLARKMIELAEVHQPIRISYTGLRPGEKLHESLFFDEEFEQAEARPDERMWRCPSSPMPERFMAEVQMLLAAAGAEDGPAVLSAMARLVPGYGGAEEPVLGAIYPDGL